MSYTPHDFENGDILYASDLNDIDNQISAISNIITPQQFNAVGDGTTDDTSALSTTFNRSNAVIEGGNLSYKIGEIVLNERNNLIIRNFKFYQGISITLKHCQNIIFQNCIWDEFWDNGIANKTVHCVILTTVHTGPSEWIQANNWRISEVCKNITFDNCQFLTTHFTENTPSLFVDTKPHYNTGMCIRLDGVDGLKVRNCYFTQNRGNACIQSNTYAPLGDFEFTNNFFYLNCWGGIELYRYTGISSYPTRIIQGNRFIGHGLGYLPWSYLSQIPETERGVGTAVLLGGNVVRIQNEPAHCAVINNYFEDNNESSVEGWQWNPVKDNIILGNGVLQTSDSVTEMTQKYKITYQLYPRQNPSENPIYMHSPSGSAQYSFGETRSIENNTIGRMYGNKNPILFRGDYYEPVIIRNNTMTDEALLSDKNCKFVHILGATFKRGLVWENNIGMRPYFNECTFDGGEYYIDDMMDVYNCTFNSQAFESISKTDRFQVVKASRFNEEFATMRDNEVSLVSNGKPVLGAKRFPAIIDVPTPIWDIRDEVAYQEGGYVFGGESDPTILDTSIDLGGTDTGWTIFVDANTVSDNGAGNNTYLIKLLTFSNASGGDLSLEFGSRYTDEVWTWLFPNGVWSYDTTYQVDQNGSKSYLKPGKTARFVLRHKQGGGKIEVFARHDDGAITTFDALCSGDYAFTSGTAGTLKFGGLPNSDKPKSYYNGKIIDASVYDKALTDSEVSMLMVGTDISSHELPPPVYDIEDDVRFVSGTGLIMDGTFAIDTNVPLLQNTNDFTIVVQYQFDNIGQGGARPNFTFIPVFSAMNADMPNDVHTGHADKGFDIGLSMQDGKDLSNTAIGGFMMFRRDWRYVNNVPLDMYSYNQYQNNIYTFFIIRKDDVIRLYNDQLVKIGELTGDYATSIIFGNLTIGAKMGYTSGYTDFFKGVIKEFKVYDVAADLYELEKTHPSLDDNDASYKGAVKYHLCNKNNARNNVRYALVEINYDLGPYNSASYTAQYPQAFGIRLDNIYDGIVWIPCSSSKRAVFCKRCKWDAKCDAFEDWNIEIANPGIVPNLQVEVTGVKVLLLSHQEAIPNTTDATDFHISWDNDPTALSESDVVIGYVQFIPEDATSGTTITAASEDTSIATVAVDGQNVAITAVAVGETVVHVAIPYGTEYLYRVVVTT